MKKMKLVMVGNGMAGVRTIEELLKIAPDLYDITVFGAEPHPNYNRILLSPVLSGEQTLDEIVLNPLDWYAQNNIDLRVGRKVVGVNRKQRIVQVDDGSEVEYDRLLIATGSNPFMLPIPGKDLQGVIGYRDIADTNAMIEAAPKYQHAVVIGGGLLGLEAANGLMLRGMQVTRDPPRRLADGAPARRRRGAAAAEVARAARAALPARRADAGADRRPGRPRDGGAAEGRQRDPGRPGRDGGRHPAEHRTGAEDRPALRPGEPGGIAVNDTMQTVTDPRIYSVGECAAHRGIAYGLVAPLFEQAKVCATHLAEFGIGRYTGSQVSTKLKVTGIDLFSAGNFTGGPDCEEIVMSDPYGGVYKKLVLKDDKLVGACMYGDTVDGAWYFKLLREGRSVADIRDKLMFGESNIGDAGHQGHNKAAAMADSRRGLRLQRRQQGHRLQGDQGEGPVHAGRRAQAHQGERLVRIVHRTRRAAADVHRRRRLLGRAEEEGDVRLHRRQPPGSARRHQGRAPADDRQRLPAPGLAHAQRLLELPPGGQLLPDQHLAEGGARRSAEPLHQRAQPRQHPEGRHLQRDPAHVGRRDHRRRAAPHRRCGRQVQDPDRQGDRRPAHRPARREEGGPGRMSGRTSACRAAMPTPRRCAR